MGKSLVERQNLQETRCDLPRTHQKDIENTQRSLQSSQRPGGTNENGKNRPPKFPALQKRARILLPGVPIRKRAAIRQERSYRLPSTYWEKEQVWNDRRKALFGRIRWEAISTQPKLAGEAAQFMKSLGLIDQFKSVTLD